MERRRFVSVSVLFLLVISCIGLAYLLVPDLFSRGLFGLVTVSKPASDSVTASGECNLVGDNAPCGNVTSSEVISLINQWLNGQASVTDVMKLINMWPTKTTTTTTLPSSSLTLTSPNGGETWQRGTTHTVTWTHGSGITGYVKIVLLKGGVEIGTIIPSAPVGSGGAGYHVWNISKDSSLAVGSDFTVSVQSLSQPTIKDASNAYFTLTSPSNTTTSTQRNTTSTTHTNTTTSTTTTSLTTTSTTTTSLPGAYFNKLSSFDEGDVFSVVSRNGLLMIPTGMVLKIYNISNESVISKINWNTTTLYQKDFNSKISSLFFADDNKTLYVSSGNITKMNIQNPSNPIVIATSPSGGYGRLVVQGNYIYAIKGATKLEVLDSTTLNLVGSYTPQNGGTISKLDVEGNYAYVSQHFNWGPKPDLLVVDVSDPASPHYVSNFTMPSAQVPGSIDAVGNVVYMTDYYQGFFALNASNKSNLVELDYVGNKSGMPNPGSFAANDIKVYGDKAFISVRYEGFYVFNVSDPSNLRRISKAITSAGYMEGLCNFGNYTFVADSTVGVLVFNSTNLSAPRYISTIAFLGEINWVDYYDDILYVATRNSGVFVFDVSNKSNPVMVNKIKGGLIYDNRRTLVVAHQDNLLFVESDFYLALFDITDRRNPVGITGEILWNNDGKPSVVPDGNILYYRSYILNISNPATPTTLFRNASIGRYLVKKLPNDVILYVQAGDIVTENVRNKSSPVELDRINGSSFAPLDVYDYNGSKIAVVGATNFLGTYNVTDPANITLLYSSGTKYNGVWSPGQIHVSGNVAYASGAILKAFDLSNPNNLITLQSTNFPSGGGAGASLEGGYWYVPAGTLGFTIFNIST